jgi:hypothetical protein
MITVPLIDANDMLIEVELDEETYFLHIGWNTEAATWSMEIENYNKQTIVAGIVLVPNTPLLALYKYLEVPAGELIVVMMDDNTVPGRDSFNDGTASLVYLTAEEVAAAVEDA